MSDKFSKDECDERHDNMMVLLLDIKADGAYNRGKLDTMEKSQSNTWTWLISIGAMFTAWFNKGV